MITNKKDWYIINSGYTSAPASTSTITTAVDMRNKIYAGMGVRYDIGGTYYYGVVVTMAAALITIAGASLSGAILELAVCDESRVIVKDYHLEGYNAGNTNTGLETLNLWDLGDMWLNSEARLVRIGHCNESDDTAGAGFNPYVNMMVDLVRISTSNGNQGKQVGATPAVVYTDIDINTTNYVVSYTSRI